MTQVWDIGQAFMMDSLIYTDDEYLILWQGVSGDWGRIEVGMACWAMCSHYNCNKTTSLTQQRLYDYFTYSHKSHLSLDIWVGLDHMHEDILSMQQNWKAI